MRIHSRLRTGVFSLVSSMCVFGTAWCGLGAVEGPPLNEVLELLKAHQHTYSAEELNKLAVEGLLQRLGGLARFADVPETNSATASAAAGVTNRLFDGKFGYLRITSIEPSTRAELERILAESGTNKTVKGWVLDLRFVNGRDFAAAAQVADAFIPAGKPLMDWGQGLFVSSEKPSDKEKLPPLAVLVNRQTRGAAEAVAAVLRSSGAALVIGGSTAGEVARYEEFALSNGRKLRLAVAPVKGSDGSFLAPTGVQPDIAVSVPEAEERGWMEDPFGASGVAASAGGAAAGTNSVAKPRRRLTEADLVRARREGKSGGQGTNAVSTAAPVTPPVRVVRDPSLARALDLLKGLSVIRSQ
jgi:hypothetical protein